MAIIKSIYGNEDQFISLPDAVRWIASNYGLSEHLSSQITRQKILSIGKNIYVYVDLYGKIIDESNDVEFYLVANQNKIYYKHELEYVNQLFEYLSEYGSYKAPIEEDLNFFYYNYYIKKDDLYSFFNVSEKETENLKKPEPKEIIQEYDGDIPLQTNKDKLAHTFKLIIQQSKFVEMNDGKYPTYSQLHTMLNRTYKDELIPSKNTLKKYLEP